MTHTLGEPVADQRPRSPDRYDQSMIFVSGAPNVLSISRGDPGSPRVVFLPGTMTHRLFCGGLLVRLHRLCRWLVDTYRTLPAADPLVDHVRRLVAVAETAEAAVR